MRSVLLAAFSILIALALPGFVVAEALKVTPHLLVFTEKSDDEEQDSRPTVLRGSGMKPAPHARRPRGSTTLQAGDTLWLADVARNRLTACELKRTSAAGQRAIRCARRDLRLD